MRLPEVIVLAVRRFPDNEKGSKDRHSKWLRSCTDIDSCVTTMSVNMVIWLATQIDREAVLGTHAEAWAAYRAVRDVSPDWRGWTDECEAAMLAYQVVVEPYCRVLVRGWMRGVMAGAAERGDA